MDIGSTISIIGFAALVAAFFLPVIVLVYSELMNSDILCGPANSGKLHTVHGSFVSLATEDKWSQTGWRIEQRYGNKVLLGNWAEDRLQFTREQKIANSTSHVDYRPHWDFKPDILKRRSAVLRAEGLPHKMLFGHHRPPPSHYLATEYKQSYAEKHNSSLPTVSSCDPDNLTHEPENCPYSALSTQLKSTNHSCEKLQSQLPTLTVYQSTYQSHPLGAFCKNRFARASRTLSSCLHTTNHINKDLNLRQRLLLQVPDHCFSQEMITKQT